MDDLLRALDRLTVSDFAQIAGTLIAALIGIVGLAVVLGIERRDRYRGGLDSALAAVIAALGDRELALRHWADLPFGAYAREQRLRETGGPSAAELEAVIEVACMVATKRKDRACLLAIRETVHAMPLAPVSRQLLTAGPLRAIIREWRVGTCSPKEVIDMMTDTIDGFAAARRVALGGTGLAWLDAVSSAGQVSTPAEETTAGSGSSVG